MYAELREQTTVLDDRHDMLMPANRPDGDGYIVVISKDGSGPISQPPGDPFDVLFDAAIGGDSARLWIGYREGASEPAVYQFTATTNEQWKSSIHRVNGQQAGNFIGAVSPITSGNSNNAAMPDLVVQPGALLFWVVASDSDAVLGFATGTSRWLSLETGPGDAHHGVATFDSPGGQSPPNNATLAASDSWVGIAFEVLPSGGGGVQAGELEVTFPPIPPTDSAGAPSHPTSWNVYIDDPVTPIDFLVPIGTTSKRYPVTIPPSYDFAVQVSLTNELGEGPLSPATRVSNVPTLGVPSQPGAPMVSLIIIGGQPPPPPPPPAGQHSYYESLILRSDLHAENWLRHQDDIDLVKRNPATTSTTPVYDAAEDACKLTSSGGEVVSNDRFIIPWADVASGTLLVTWDTKWDTPFNDYSNLGPGTLVANKSWQFNNSGNDERTFELRQGFNSGAFNPLIGRWDARCYSNPQGWDAAVGDNSPVEPQAGEYNHPADKWVRMWVYFDWPNLQITWWAADEDNAPVKILDAVQMNSMTEGLEGLESEFNSSQDSGSLIIPIWVRNVVVLKDITESAQNIVNAGATVL